MKTFALVLLATTGCILKPAHTAAPRHVDLGPWAGPLAQKHAGEVVFSSAPIRFDAADDSAAFTTYALGDPLFMRFWAKDAPTNLLPCKGYTLSDDSGYSITFYADVDGAGKAAFGSYSLGTKLVDKRQMSTLSKDPERAFTSPSLLGSRDDDPTIRGFNSTVVPKLHEGKNTLRIVVALSCVTGTENPVLAEGTLDVQVPPGSKETYLAKYGPRVQPSPHPENARLVPEILAAMQKKGDWDNEVFIGASVTSEAWEPVRNPDTGVLTAYEINALLFVRAKSEKDPDACRVFDMSYRRDPAGGTLYYAGTGDSRPFPCSGAPH